MLNKPTLVIGLRLSPSKKENQEWWAPYGITHDEVDMCLMDGDVCSSFKWMGDYQL